MLRRSGVSVAAIAAAALMLASCGGSGHAVCKDAESTASHTRAFTEDMIAAASAGKLAPDAMTKLQTELDGISKGSGTDFSGFCVKLDDLRKKYSL